MVFITAHSYYAHIVFDNESWHFFIFRYNPRPSGSRVMIHEMIAFSTHIYTPSLFKNLLLYPLPHSSINSSSLKIREITVLRILLTPARKSFNVIPNGSIPGF